MITIIYFGISFKLPVEVVTPLISIHERRKVIEIGDDNIDKWGSLIAPAYYDQDDFLDFAETIEGFIAKYDNLTVENWIEHTDFYNN